MLDRRLVEDVAFALAAPPALVEKDWHVVRAIGLLAALDPAGEQMTFCGGTSLSIGWGLLKRFSEDIDFKVALPPASSKSAARAGRSTYRKRVLDALAQGGLVLEGEPRKGDNNTFFSAAFAYDTQVAPSAALRPHLQIEMTFESPVLPPVPRPLQSLIARAQKKPPEIAAFPCVDPVETAAEKLSALAWRVCARERGSDRDDPRIIRHLHDLAALETMVRDAKAFPSALARAVAGDAGRGGDRSPAAPTERFALMLSLLRDDTLWARDYDEYVGSVSFAAPEERISFTAALAALRRLVETCAPN